MSFSIAGKTAVVTGAANGVGLAIARHFVDRGANVMFADSNEAKLEQELGALDDDSSARMYAGDLCQKLDVANLLSATIDAFDRVDVVVNACRSVQESDPLEPDDDSVQRLLDRNLMTALRVSQLFSKRMIKQAKQVEDDEPSKAPIGSIVNLSSIAARRTHARLLAYSVSTAALDQMTRSLAVALAPHRIRVNGVAFGSVMSESLRSAIREQDEMREEIIDHTPLHRIAAAGELAETVQFLAADGSGFMTGQILTLDGGRTLVDPCEAPAH